MGSDAGFEMRSTSGRTTCEFEVEDSVKKTTLRLGYSWSAYGPTPLDWTKHEVVLPSAPVVREELLAFASQARRFGEALGRNPTMLGVNL